MTRLLMSPLSSKGQLTLPREVRAILGLKSKGELVGFLVDLQTKTVRVARIEPVLASEDFTAAELRRLLRWRGKGRGKTFKSMSALLRDLKRY